MTTTLASPRRAFPALVALFLSFAVATAAHAQNRRSAPAGPPPVSGIGADGKLGPVVRDGMMYPVLEFADSSQIIRQSLWVETNFDSDHDGKPDRVHVQVTRPGAAEKAGLKIPTIMLSSPYIGPTNGEAPDWDVDQELGAASPARKIPAYRQFSDTMPLRAGWTQWVSRGFAAVTVENAGTGLSTGCPTVGDSIEDATPKFAIDWLNGRAKGYTTVDGNVEVSATSWSNGKVGMTGTSYEGTMPLAAAITGVQGLEAIIPISPNTSQYKYYRSNGLVRSPGGYLGEDVAVLYDFIHSGRVRAKCDEIWRDGIFAQQADRQTGDFNQFWADRDQTPLVKNIHAAVLFAHGFNDWNVMPDHTIRMWDALKNINPSAKIYMSQGGHGAPPPADIQAKWWAHYLYGVNNGVDTLPRAMIVQSTATAPVVEDARGRARPGTPAPTFFADYPVPGSAPVEVHLSKGGSAAGSAGLVASSAKQGMEKLVDDFHVTPATMAMSASSPNRLIYALPALTDSIHLSGRAVVTLKLAASKPAVNLSVYLVTLPYDSTHIGSAGEVGVVTRGWADPQNWKSLTGDVDYTSMAKGEPLVPGRFYTMSFPLQPDDQIILPGQQLALMIFSSDAGFTLHPAPGAELTIDLDGSSFTIPVVGGKAKLQAALGTQ